MKNRRIVIASHGRLAEGFKSALHIITGTDDVEAYNCYETADFNLQNTIDQIMITHDSQNEDLFVFTDLFGGSVNNGFVSALKDNDFYLITNTSLGLLIDFLVTEPDIDTFKTKLISNEFNAVYCNDYVTNMSGIEEDL